MAIASKLAEVMEIPLSNGGVALVSPEDFDRVSSHVWHRDTSGYARAMVKLDGKWRLVRMHRFVLSPPNGTPVDHANGIRLDNTRANLRECSATQNSANVRKYSGRSKFKGVCWHAGAGRWMSQIRTGGKSKYLGLFDTEESAASAYAAAASEIHGQFARTA